MKPNWHSPKPFAFMKDMALENENNEPAGLTCTYRHDVATRYWWTLEWTGADGNKYSASAQSVAGVFEKAIAVELKARERLDAKEKELFNSQNWEV